MPRPTRNAPPMKSAGRRRAKFVHVIQHVGDAFLADLIRKTPQLVAGHVDVLRDHFVLVAQLVAGAAEHIGDAAKPVRGAILLLVNARRNVLLDVAQQSMRGAAIDAGLSPATEPFPPLGAPSLELFLVFVGMFCSSNERREQETIQSHGRDPGLRAEALAKAGAGIRDPESGCVLRAEKGLGNNGDGHFTIRGERAIVSARSQHVDAGLGKRDLYRGSSVRRQWRWHPHRRPR